MEDLEFEGGSKSGGRKKKQQGGEKGCFGKLVGLGGGNNSGKKHGGPEKEWSEMTDDQKKQRIQYLWAKARRYNNKLRF